MGQSHRKEKTISSIKHALTPSDKDKNEGKKDGKQSGPKNMILPTARRPASREYKYETSLEKVDPCSILPPEIFIPILSMVPVKDVASQCSLVSRDWYQACNDSRLWKLFIFHRLRDQEQEFKLYKWHEAERLKQAGSVLHPLHPHALAPNARNNGWCCDGRTRTGGCRRGITGFNQTTNVPRHRCTAGCDYDLCDKCLEDISLTTEPCLQSSTKSESAEPAISVMDEHAGIMLVNQTEETENGLALAEERFPSKIYKGMNEWKKYFAFKAIGEVRWMPDSSSDAYELEVSGDGLMATLSATKSAHANCWGRKSFSTGTHTWRVKVDGLEATGFWCALGVTSETHKHFGYNSAGKFTGYSGAGNIFSKDGEQTQGVAKRWKNGDVIKMTLDCDHNVMHFWINDEPLTSLPTLPGPLWPWGNGYVRGCSLTIVTGP